MRMIKSFKQFNEGYVDDKGEMYIDWNNSPHVNKNGKIEGLDFTEEEEEFIELADLGLKMNKFLEDDTYLSLEPKLKEIYKEMAVEDKKVFFHGPILVDDIIKDYKEECKVIIEKDILESTQLPYYFEVIDILPLDLQLLIISLIINNFKNYSIKQKQYDSFNLEVQNIIDKNTNIIKIKKQGYY